MDPPESKIKILHQNCNKAHDAYIQLKTNISSLSADLICIQEPYQATNLPNLFSFNPTLYYTQDSPTNPPYSVIYAHNRNLSTSHITSFSNRFITTISIQIRSTKLLLVNVYLLPNDPNFDAHLILLSNILLDPQFQNLPIILTGDFNARHTHWLDHHTNTQGRKLFNFITTHALSVHNNSEYTCIRSNGSGIIDLTLTNTAANFLINEWKVGEDDSDSDHELISFSLNLNPPSPNNYFDSTWKFFENDKTNWANFSTNIDTSSLELLPTNATPNEIDNAVLKLEMALTEAAYKSLSIRILSSKRRDKTNLWWNDDLQLMKNSIKQLKSKIKATTNIFWKNKHKQQLTSIRNQYKKMCKFCRNQSWRDFVSDYGNEKPWGVTSSLIKMLSNPTTKLEILTNSVDPGQTLDNLMAASFPDDSESDDSNESAQIRQHSHLLSNSEILLSNYGEISSIVKNLNNKKTPGPDGISNRMIKAAHFKILPFLTNLINSCLSLGHFPRRWKQASVIFIPKPGKSDYHSTSAYRPISLLSNIGKILEKIIKSRMEQYALRHNLLDQRQYGFTRGKSTIDALQDIVDTILQHKEDYKCATILIDIQGAFDSCWWPGITYDIDKDSYPAYLTQSVMSFFQNRQIECTFASHYSSKTLTKGCPQGSALSPLLWNININDLLRSWNIPNTHPVIFADDGSFVCWGPTEASLHSTISESINQIRFWCQRRKLQLSLGKTNVLLTNSKIPFPIRISDHNIAKVTSTKILGIYLDSKLNFREHINYICKKINPIQSAFLRICKNKFGLSSNHRITLYKSLIRSAISYGSEIWASRSSNRSKLRLEKIQYWILRGGLCAYKSVSYKVTYNFSKVAPLLDFLSGKDQIHRAIQNKITKLDPIARFLPQGRFDSRTHLRIITPNIRFSNNHTSNDITIHTATFISTDFANPNGGACVIMRRDHILYSHRYKFHNYTKNNQIVLFLVRMSLRFLCTNDHLLRNGEPIVIRINHKSTINNLLFNDLLTKNEAKCNNFIAELSDHQFILSLAVQPKRPPSLSKMAIPNRIPKFSYCYYERKSLKPIVDTILDSKQTTNYNTDITNFTYKAFFPNNSRKTKPFIITDFYVTQHLTGHGAFEFYLHNRKIVPDKCCPCDRISDQTVEHILIHCTLFNTLIIHLYGSRPTSLPVFIQDKKSFSLFKILTVSIHKWLVKSRDISISPSERYLPPPLPSRPTNN